MAIFDAQAPHPQTLVLATGNRGKVQELTELLLPLGWHIRPQSEWQLADADETGTTFVENAIIKARHACQATGLPALADDSGLAVDALDGAPGIYSSRYAGTQASDQDNIAKLLEAMADVPLGERTAHFHCVLVLMQHADDPTPIICHGTWHGHITNEPAGTQGFGYDPVFYVPNHNCTAAQLSPTIKQSISHRGRALATLREELGHLQHAITHGQQHSLWS